MIKKDINEISEFHKSRKAIFENLQPVIFFQADQAIVYNNLKDHYCDVSYAR